MKSNCRIFCLSLLSILALAGCNISTPTPTAQLLIDSPFSGYAFLDTNSNGQLDAEDTPLAGATFSVAINGVKAFSEITDKNGYAFILIPGRVDYPVTLSMEAPKNSSLTLIGPSEISFKSAGESPKFLFTSK